MDATGSDKSYPFFHEGTSDLLIVTEAPIDLMSHASIAADFMGGLDGGSPYLHRLPVEQGY